MAAPTLFEDDPSTASVVVDVAPLPGLPSHFETLRTLGSGGFGAVFAVRDRRSDQELALKRLERADANSIYRFKQEFRIMQGRTHPNLVRLHELFSVDSYWCFTMDRIDGLFRRKDG
jgi:serine/threonine protein kinase